MGGRYNMRPEADLDSQPVIRTKLYPPSLPDDCVSRGRLIYKLEESRNRPLAVVTAPAGFGKTVLACEWQARLKCDSVWLSLDSGDGDLRRFLTYLVTGVEQVFPTALASVSDQLSSSKLAPLPLVAAGLINDLDKLPKPLVIFFDDFDRIDNGSPVFDLLSLLLERPPRNLQLVLLSRRGLPLDLGRLRASADLLEIRMQDLRFSASETAALMGAAVRTALTERALDHLGEELEGWPVGLRLVSLVVGRSSDPSSAVESLHGGIPQVQEYLLNEVLSGLDPRIRNALRDSSVLDRFSAELIDAVSATGEPTSDPKLSGKEFISELSRLNLFTYSLDAQGRWFRCHHWFQYMLHSLLLQERDTASIRNLHLKAANWLASRFETEEAILHYLQADEADEAGDLIAQAIDELLETNRWDTAERWIAMLPESTRTERVDIQLACAWVGFCKLDIELVRDSVVAAEGQLAGQASSGKLNQQFDFLRGWLLFWQGDLAESAARLRSSLGGFRMSPGMIAGEARLYLSLATGLSGNYTEAIEFLAKERVAGGRDIGLPFLLRLVGGQAHLYYLSGDIDAAVAAVDRMKLLQGFGSNIYAIGWAEYMHGLYEFNRGAFASAIEHFKAATKHIHVLERRAAVDLLAGHCLAMRFAGEPEELVAEALSELDVFVRNYGLDDYVWIVEAVNARLSIHTGKTDAALKWAESVIVPETDPVEALFWICNPAVTRARVLALFGSGEALTTVSQQMDGLLEKYCKYHNHCQIIDIQPVRALALSRQGRHAESRQALRDAIRLGSSSKWRRAFLELGEPLLALLRDLDFPDGQAGFVKELLAEPGSIDDAVVSSERTSIEHSGSVSKQTAPGLGDEALTNRELDILELLERRLQNKEIAAQLHISPHTVGYHLKHIYQKLAVNGRRQAVVKARASGIL